jgi:uncharacterized protein YeaO (DUF488 family)
MTRPSGKKRSRPGLSTYIIGQEAAPGSLRLGTVRRPPRGVRKEKLGDYYDVWLPLLAPSDDLLRWWNADEASTARFRTFTQRYKKEMAGSDKRSAVALVAALATRLPVAIGCYCDRPQCHRFLLERMIREAMA